MWCCVKVARRLLVQALTRQHQGLAQAGQGQLGAQRGRERARRQGRERPASSRSATDALVDGGWVEPTDVELANEAGKRSARQLSTGEALVIGDIEKMSKSKKNVVDPDEIIRDYGADTARWFMLSDSPPERDLEWTEAGVTGAWRFQQRLDHRHARDAIGAEEGVVDEDARALVHRQGQALDEATAAFGGKLRQCRIDAIGAGAAHQADRRLYFRHMSSDSNACVA